MIDISIIIPTLDEEHCMRQQLQILPRIVDPYAVEIIVVDGGSRDQTATLAAELGRVIYSPPGRARQMNAGAQAARGDTLLFLHADTLLPANGLTALRRIMRRRDVVGGAFRKEPFRRPLLLRLADIVTNLRLELRLTLYGDRAIYARRRAFTTLGGFDERLDLLEDVDLGKRLRRLGKLAQVPAAIRTSDRRFMKSGAAQTLLLMAALEVGWRLGLDVNPLARRYKAVR